MCNRRRQIQMSFASLALLIAGLSPALASSFGGGNVLFVDDDAPANGDGATWETAYRFLQDALSFAGDPKNNIAEIRVGQGSYKPDRDESNPDGTGDREATFNLVDGVSLLGGYAGLGAEDPDARDIELYETILSGDLLGDDGDDFANNEENSNNIAMMIDTEEATLLEGFTISGGNGPAGAGVSGEGGAPTIARCRFENNSADALGGGLFWLGGQVNLFECLFSRNRALDEGGGAWLGPDQASPLVGCEFVLNEAEVAGGLYYGYEGGPVLFDSCRFEGNIATDGAGALRLCGSPAEFALVDCVFEGNSGLAAGAIGTSGDVVTMTQCSFIGNTALGAGAIVNSGPELELVDCEFTGNCSTEGWGGAIYTKIISMEGCVFTDNHAAVSGGAIAQLVLEEMTYQDCTFIGNSAGVSGGAIWSEGGGEDVLILTGCEFHDNEAPLGGAVIQDHKGTMLLDNCLIATNSADFGGGVYGERSSVTVVNSAFIANNADQGGGFYASSGETNVIQCEFRDNAAISGGAFAGDDQWTASIFDCQFIANHAEDHGGALWADGDSIIAADCTFDRNTAGNTGGAITIESQTLASIERCGFSANTASSGGGLMNHSFAATFVDSAFVGNSASAGGGVCDDGMLLLSRCVVEENLADVGGGLHKVGGPIELRDCQFNGNIASQLGGGLFIAGFDVVLERCAISHNTAAEQGGGMWVDLAGDQSVITNCLFAHNLSTYGGGLYWNDSLDMLYPVSNCTIVANEALERGGGAYIDEPEPFVFSNCVLWANEPQQIFDDNDDEADVRYSCIEGGLNGEGNIESDPLFVDARAGDYRLAGGSPCIDAADNNALPADITLDLDGANRFVNDFNTRDTGLGAPPIVDMGAYEFQVKGCAWDFDSDGDVDANDLIILLGAWGSPYDAVDLNRMLAHWGPCR